MSHDDCFSDIYSYYKSCATRILVNSSQEQSSLIPVDKASSSASLDCTVVHKMIRMSPAVMNPCELLFTSDRCIPLASWLLGMSKLRICFSVKKTV